MTIYKPNHTYCLGSKETAGSPADSQHSVWFIEQFLSQSPVSPAELEGQPAILQRGVRAWSRPVSVVSLVTMH